MTLIPLDLPPGFARPGTIYGARGRWYDGNLVRWYGGGKTAMQAVGGWSTLSGAGSAAVGGAVRGMHAWRVNSSPWVRLGIGSTSNFYVWNSGTLTLIYTTTLVGNPDSTGADLQDQATTWQMDNYGEDLVFLASHDERLQYYDSSAGTVTRIQDSAHTGAPDFCQGVVVTPERMVVALAPGGDQRKVQWCDQEDGPLAAWTPTATNQAGSFTLSSRGAILAARRARNETLIWTDADLWAMRYIGGELIYSFTQVGAHCGAISRLAMAMVDGKAVWMGERGFHTYDGYVQSVPCEVEDYVFNDLDRSQRHKIAADVRSDFGEVWWYYPSETGSGENDRYVAWNWRLGFWMIGEIERTSGVDRGIFENPIAADASGALYEHETGTTHTDEGGAPAYTPYAESGPVELGQGDRVLTVQQWIPDEAALGGLELRIYTRLYPMGDESTHGPYTAAEQTSVRVTGRQFRVRFTQVTGGWRSGTHRFDVVPRGRR